MIGIRFSLVVCCLLICCIAGRTQSRNIDIIVTLGFYVVAINGNDSNAGTLDAPFASLGKCQTAMRNSKVKTCYIRAGTYTPAATGNCNGEEAALVLGNSDVGETWSYYPPDGYHTAIINGQATGPAGSSGGLPSAFCIALSGTTPSNVTINGLYLENFAQYPIWTSSPNTTIINNIIDNSYNYGIIATGSPTDVVIAHNYVTNTAFHGIEVEVEVCGTCRPVEGTTVANNFVLNTCTGSPISASDCGTIYAIDHTNNTAWATTPLKIVNNYIRDGYKTNGGSRGIYIDRGTSNVQATGNIVSGIMLYENQLHGGSNDSWTANIIDLENNTGAPILFYQNYDTSSMTNNTFSNNIIVASMNGKGAGYLAGNSPPTPLAISNNIYWNYGTGGYLNNSGSGGSGSSGDSSATNENPNFTCGWEYTLPSNSPLYGSPVNFPAQPADWGRPGFWGPPGFIIPQVGTPPSPLILGPLTGC